MGADRGDVGWYSTETDWCKMVSCDVVLRLRGYITVRLRSCAVMLGFEQRCIVKKGGA